MQKLREFKLMGIAAFITLSLVACNNILIGQKRGNDNTTHNNKKIQHVQPSKPAVHLEEDK